MLFGGEEKIEFEGIDAQVNHCIYDSIETNNFKDKIVDHQRYYISKREGSSHELPKYKIIKPYTENIKFRSYIEIAKWLIQLNFLSVLLTELENVSSSHDDAIALELHFKFGPKLKENITAITNLLHNDRLSYWAREGVIFMASGNPGKFNTAHLSSIFSCIELNNNLTFTALRIKNLFSMNNHAK
ncbi:hypothetical protein RhiirA1_478515 [Rhizophagus irregularis]|nr:hypothetical protein RhiirA1_478515 [Rhizophagus irregularis]